MTRVFSLIASTLLSSFCLQRTLDESHASVDEWQYHSGMTIWLLANGNFETKEVPFAQTKPSPTIYLKGSWTADKGVLTLPATQKALTDSLSTPPRSFNQEKVDFLTTLTVDAVRKVMILRQNQPNPHRTGSADDCL